MTDDEDPVAFRQGPRILERARALGVVSSSAKEIEEIAREFDVPEERVRKIVACAIEKKPGRAP